MVSGPPTERIPKGQMVMYICTSHGVLWLRAGKIWLMLFVISSSRGCTFCAFGSCLGSGLNPSV